MFSLTLKLYPNMYIMYNIQDPAFTHQHYGLGFPGGSDGKESTCNAGDLGSIPGWGIYPEEGMATHSSILTWSIPMDRGACLATDRGVTKSRTQLSK